MVGIHPAYLIVLLAVAVCFSTLPLIVHVLSGHYTVYPYK
jgi:hypothetical protein